MMDNNITTKSETTYKDEEGTYKDEEGNVKQIPKKHPDDIITISEEEYLFLVKFYEQKINNMIPNVTTRNPQYDPTQYITKNIPVNYYYKHTDNGKTYYRLLSDKLLYDIDKTAQPTPKYCNPGILLLKDGKYTPIKHNNDIKKLSNEEFNQLKDYYNEKLRKNSDLDSAEKIQEYNTKYDPLKYYTKKNNDYYLISDDILYSHDAIKITTDMGSVDIKSPDFLKYSMGETDKLGGNRKSKRRNKKRRNSRKK